MTYACADALTAPALMLPNNRVRQTHETRPFQSAGMTLNRFVPHPAAAVAQSGYSSMDLLLAKFGWREVWVAGSGFRVEAGSGFRVEAGVCRRVEGAHEQLERTRGFVVHRFLLHTKVLGESSQALGSQALIRPKALEPNALQTLQTLALLRKSGVPKAPAL